MTLDKWIRGRRPRLSDTAFGRMMQGPGTAAVTQQAVGMWRRGERVPRPEYLRRIAEVTGGAVGEDDFARPGGRDAAKEREMRRVG